MDSQKIHAKTSIFEKGGKSVFLDKIEPLFQSDEELGADHEYYGLDLDHRLYKLFKLSEDEIAVIEGE